MKLCTTCNQKKKWVTGNTCRSCYELNRKRNNPEYYLRVKYNDMYKRVTGKQKSAQHYKGLPICSREQFITLFIHDPQYINIYEDWQSSGYSRVMAPSIDRISNSGGYTLDNMQIIPDYLNLDKYQKTIKTPILYDGVIYESQQSLARHLNKDAGAIQKALKRKTTYLGKKIEYLLP